MSKIPAQNETSCCATYLIAMQWTKKHLDVVVGCVSEGSRMNIENAKRHGLFLLFSKEGAWLKGIIRITSIGVGQVVEVAIMAVARLGLLGTFDLVAFRSSTCDLVSHPPTSS